jgi:hypothetical protein
MEQNFLEKLIVIQLIKMFSVHGILKIYSSLLPPERYGSG